MEQSDHIAQAEVEKLNPHTKSFGVGVKKMELCRTLCDIIPVLIEGGQKCVKL